MKITKSAGVYMIIDISNNKRYIGGSNSIRKRILFHQSELRRNIHKTEGLQNSYNKNPNNIQYVVLEEINDLSLLREREQFYINQFNPEDLYNKHKNAYGAKGHKMPENFKKEQSQRYKGKNNPFFGKQHSKEFIEGRRGSGNPNSKLTEDQVREIKRRLNQGLKQVEIAKEFAIDQSVVSNIKRGKRWAHIQI